ncbi:MAG: efflux RND transporter permease subunit [Ignavibacteria bacterium]|nr:efflux RND transporter permease subunit [Ignavibacteria bacterium]
MNISVLSIRRPVTAIVISLIFILMGLVGASFLGIRQFPDVDPPNITVTTSYIGANADVVESQITEPLEESINGIDGIRSLTSTSADGRSTITVEFELGRDLEQAANDVRDRVERAKRQLPADVDPPVVAKADANSQAIIVMTVQSTKRTLPELSDYAANVLKERIQTITGVGNITIWGERRYAMRIVMDPEKLAGYDLTSNDVRLAMQRENVELPAGRLEGDATELSLRTVGRLSTLEDFENLIIRSDGSGVVHLSDVARVYLGAENERTLLRRDGVPMVGLAVSPQPGANQIEIVDEFYRRYEALRSFAPKDLTLQIAFDNTTFIRTAISEVEETILIAFSLVVLIIFLFLRSWRATIIPVVAIPVSLLSSFFFLWVFGFSINLLTLLGIVLATGLVVDDAIVMMENIYKRIENGENAREAGEKGSTEITFAIISTTITLAVVFLPVIFLSGITGALFREFGLVVASSVVISAIVSLTLTPMMSTRLLHKEEHANLMVRLTEPVFTWMTNVYARTVQVVVDRPLIAIAAVIVSAASIVLIGGTLKTELAPLEDRGQITMNMTAPEGTTFDRMNIIVDSMQQRLTQLIPERKFLLTVTSPSFFSGGSNSAFARIFLIDADQRKRSQMDIAAGLTKVMRDVTEVRSVVIQEQTISSGGRAGLPVQYVLQAAELEELREVLPTFLDRASKDPTFSVVDVNLKFTKPEVAIEIDRARARELGVSVLDIANALQSGFSGQRFGYLIRDGKQYQIIGELERASRSTPDALRMVQVRTSGGELVPLADLVLLREQSIPPQLYRNNRSASATVSAGLAPGKTIADGIAAMDVIAKETLDARFGTSLTGASRDFAESSSSLLFAFMLALVLVYLILAAQFESWVDPVTIMLTVPLALSGAALSLWITGDTLNIFSQIGGIVLIGLVTKNGILIVEFANQRRAEGLTWREAALEAAALRFRPILMTSLATILGSVPIAFSLGAASESRVGMGVVVVGGMFLATFLTLYIIPALYVVFSRIKRTRITKVLPVISVIKVLSVITVISVIPSYSAKGQPLTLDQAITIALSKSYDVALVRQDSLSARTTGKQSITGFLPNLGVAGTYTNGANTLTQVLSSGSTISRDAAGYSNMNVVAMVNWTVFDGLKMFAQADRLNASEKRGLSIVQSKMAFIIADVITAYSAIVANKQFLVTADSAYKLAVERYAIEKNRYDAGSISGVELGQAEIDRNNAQSVVIRTRIEFENAKVTLNTLLGRDAETAFDVDPTISMPAVPTRNEVYASIDATNPDVLATQYALASASAHVSEITSTFYPRIGVLGAYQITRNTSEAGFLLENRSNGAYFGATFQWNIFNGMSDAYDRELARIDEERARISIDAVKNDLRGQADRVLRTYRGIEELLVIQRQTLIAAEKNASVAIEKLRIGTVTPLEVRQSLLSLLENGQSVARLEYERRLAITEILRLQGVLVR